MKHRVRRAGGFTLIELLVVVAIIVLLIGILLPALGRARDNAKRVACLSNLRQMVIAANTYTVECDGFYPLAQYSVASGGVGYGYAWDFTTVTQLTVPGHPKTVVPGLLWSQGTSAKIQQCPSFSGAANWGSDPYTGYNYNTSYIGHGQGEYGLEDANGIVASAKVAQITNPGQTAIFGDGQYSGGADKFMRAPWPHPGDEETGTGMRVSGTQGFRHSGQTNAAFCDGHAESLVSRFTDTEESDAGLQPAAGTAFLSKDNSMYGSLSPITGEWCPD